MTPMLRHTATPLCMLFLLALTTILSAQPRGGRGPLGGPGALGLRYDYVDPAAVHQALLTYSMARPMGFAGRGAPLNRVSAWNLAIGARFGVDDDRENVRWRAALMEADWQRRWLAMGTTVLDFDRTGRLERDFRWVQFRLGIGRSLHFGPLTATPQVLGRLGLTRIDAGRLHYADPAFTRLADSTLAGVEIGYRGGVVATWRQVVTLNGWMEERLIVDGPEPRLRTFGVALRAPLGGGEGFRLALRVSATRETVTLTDVDGELESDAVRAELLWFRLPKRRNPIDDWE